MIRKIFYHFSWLVLFYHWLWALFSALFYRFPSKKIFVLGVTGTKGKSTVLELIAFILEKAKKKVAISSSVRNGSSAMTMPGRFFLQKFLRRAVNNNCDYALIEVTSQGVLQNRHRFIDWNAAIFTNLSPEHIEAHGSFEKYRKAKLSFFRYVSKKTKFSVFSFQFSNYKLQKPFIIINKEDKSAQYFIEAAKGGEVVSYGKSELESKLLGEFNKYNIGAAVAFARSQGVSDDIIKKAVADFSGVAGRMEFIQKEPFAVVVDYAHTPDSLREVYKTLHQLRQPNCKLICVLGAGGGGRDKWKRPELGKIAAQYCDEIILTNEDPYDENPLDIINQIESGFSQFQISNFKFLNRKEAIGKAIGLAKKSDTVIITGKGSEKWIHEANGQKIPWSDKETVINYLKGLFIY